MEVTAGPPSTEKAAQVTVRAGMARSDEEFHDICDRRGRPPIIVARSGLAASDRRPTLCARRGRGATTRDVLGHHLDQPLAVDRLRRIIITAGVEALLAVLAHGVRGERDDRS